MAYDFPSNPTNGTLSNGYVYNGTGWVVVPNLVATSDTPPANAPTNSLWWETDSSGLFLRYDQTWVQINSGGIVDAANDGKTYARRAQAWIDILGVVPPLPKTGAGVGQWVQISSATGAALVLPAGGTWAYAYMGSTGAGAIQVGTQAGIGAGGAQIAAATTGVVWHGFGWRIA